MRTAGEVTELQLLLAGSSSACFQKSDVMVSFLGGRDEGSALKLTRPLPTLTGAFWFASSTAASPSLGPWDPSLEWAGVSHRLCSQIAPNTWP